MPQKKLQYEWLVIIFKDGQPEFSPFTDTDQEEVEKYFEKASEQWSDSYLCKVIKGPVIHQ